MAKIDPLFVSQLEQNPDQTFDVIVRTVDDPSNYDAEIETSGLSITRKFSLIKAVAATGSASAILSLNDKPWVSKIEPDAEVRTAN